MARIPIVVFLLLACSAFWASLAHSHEQQPLGGMTFEFRDAQVEDAGDFTTVLVDAFSRAPLWKYVYQSDDDYPGYTWECTRQTVLKWLESDSLKAPLLKVISVPDETAGSGSRVVSISVWEVNRTNEDTDPLFPAMFAEIGNCSERLTVNTTRADQLLKSMSEAQETYLDNVYESQVYLSGLATHPMWDGNGFAAVHLHWGMGLADKLGLPSTLFATPAGYPLYRSVGFKDVHNVTIERLDGKGLFWHEIMKYSA